ncbi:MAG: hypothetical protein VX438_11055 [Planctomycetota bacterium]|nr:hypothetical protein [Planctomycetota bacterium]
MAGTRTQAQQQSQLAQSNQPSQPSPPSDSPSNPALTGSEQDFVVKKVAREGKEWGQLRGKSAEGNVAGRRNQVSEAYRKKVEAYFKVLAERAKLGK